MIVLTRQYHQTLQFCIILSVCMHEAIFALLCSPDFLGRDLHLCNLTAFRHRQSASAQHREVYRRLHALDDFLPEMYLNRYKNPCWYSSLQPPLEVQSKLFSTRSIITPLFHLKKAESVVSHVFKEANKKKKILTCLPAVYLAGFAKSGTTTLYTYLVSHPLLHKPAQKEGHFWRSLLSIPMNHTNKQMQVMWYMHHFSKAAQYIEANPNALTIDASASTLWIANPLFGNSYYYDSSDRRHQIASFNPDHYENSDDLCFVPSAVHSVLPQAKFVVIMRNPVKRLFSDFWYFCANKNKWHNGQNIPHEYMDNAPQIFHNLTVKAINEHKRCLSDTTVNDKTLTEFTCLRRATLGYSDRDSCFPLRLGVGMYYYHIVKWLNVYPRNKFYFLRLEDMAEDAYESVAHIWKFMGLSPIPQAMFESEINREVLNEMNWIKLPKFKERFYMLPETEQILKSFYEPINRKLAQLLNNKSYLWGSN